MTRALGILICLAGLASLMFCGCSITPTRLRYHTVSGVKNIVLASPDQISRHCAKKVVRTDDGQPVTSTTRFECCYDPNTETIWASKENIGCLTHELCHADGQPPEVCHRAPYRSLNHHGR